MNIELTQDKFKCRPPIKIGAVYPLTGAFSAYGTSILRAVKLAVDIVNKPYDLSLPLAEGEGLPNLDSRKIEIIWADSKSDLAVARNEARRLVAEEGVAALIGAFQSLGTNQVAYVAESMEVPFLNPDSSAHILTNEDKGFKWFFRTCATDTEYTKLCFELLRCIQQTGRSCMSRMAIISEDRMTGNVTLDTEMQYMRDYDYELCDLELYTLPTESLYSELCRLTQYKPRVIFGQQYLNDAILTLNTLKNLDYFPDGFVADSVGYTRPDVLKQAGADGNYVISRLAWALGLGRKKPLVYQVNELYRSLYGEDMDETNARSFTGLLVLADAINRAGSTDHYAIREALRGTNIPGSKLIMPWSGVRFDETGQNVLAKGILGQIQNDEFRIVWPPEHAETRAIWPAPAWGKR